MKDIPSDILKQFSDMLKKRSVPATAHSYYLKWLRYYLDYCAKYSLPDTSSKYLSQFLQKLREKNQTDAQQKQAGHAISLYLDMMRTTPRLQSISGCPASGQTYPLNPFPPAEGKKFNVPQQIATDETKPPPASAVVIRQPLIFKQYSTLTQAC